MYLFTEYWLDIRIYSTFGKCRLLLLVAKNVFFMSGFYRFVFIAPYIHLQVTLDFALSLSINNLHRGLTTFGKCHV